MDEDALDDDGKPPYLSNPFLDPETSRQVTAWVRKPPPRRPLAPPAQRTRVTAADAAAFAEWEERGFTLSERDVWLEGGLSRFDASIARQCIAHGLTPADLRKVVDGRRVAERLRGGESAASVAARLWSESA